MEIRNFGWHVTLSFLGFKNLMSNTITKKEIESESDFPPNRITQKTQTEIKEIESILAAVIESGNVTLYNGQSVKHLPGQIATVDFLRRLLTETKEKEIPGTSAFMRTGPPCPNCNESPEYCCCDISD